MELLQRRAAESPRPPLPAGTSGVRGSETPPPALISVTQSSVELDLLPCIREDSSGDRDLWEVEVALGLVAVGEDTEYVVIYRGCSNKISEYGLRPNNTYTARCRARNSDGAYGWSSPVSFTTVSGLPFTFCSHKRGPEITLSSDGLVATYNGDDAWSMVLGSHPFSGGTASWEVKIKQSTTAYIFVGVAKSQTDLCTFLGGDENGWGFIGEQALYHSREKVQVYGESFAKGDVVGVSLDLELGTLSFSRNGKTLGVGFNNVFGELYPAVAFYNAGQEVELLLDSCRGSCPYEPPLVSPSTVNFSEISLVLEIQHCLAFDVPIPLHICALLADVCNEWSNSCLIRRKAVSGRCIVLNKNSNLLQTFNLRYGDRIRTPFGLASVAGAAGGRLWVQLADSDEVWYFSRRQVLRGQSNGFFVRPSYQFEKKENSGDPAYTFDAESVQDLLQPARWSTGLDDELTRFLPQLAYSSGVSVWEITPEDLSREFRQLQQPLIRICMGDAKLSAVWGIKGPSRRAIIVRCALLRQLNHLTQPIAMFVDDDAGLERQGRRTVGDTLPAVTRIVPVLKGCTESVAAPESESAMIAMAQASMVKDTGKGVKLADLRSFVFLDSKLGYLQEQLVATGERPSKTEDEYDYPEDLPQVKLNRFRSHRMLDGGASGEEMLFSSMFGQLWREIRSQPLERLRIRYTHPMDDGQGRAFKVRFEGEGVDDYGGPYRDVFQSICSELQRTAGPPQGPQRCLIPFLCPTANWTVECEERYRFTFDPSQCADVHRDLFRFFGQLVGMAMRSKLTLDLALPSFIWKSVVGEPLAIDDLGSLDFSFFKFISQLKDVKSRMDTADESTGTVLQVRAEAAELLRDLHWTVTSVKGHELELVSGGADRSVFPEEIGAYIDAAVQRRLHESAHAIEAFRYGLIEVASEAIKLLRWDELEAMVCGHREIDVGRLRENTEYDADIAPTDSHIRFFWETLDEMDEGEKTAFLRFVWARPTLPPRGTPFPQKMRLQSVCEDPNVPADTYLPKAHTCFFSINLPRYSSKKVMGERLRYAISNCTEMDADYKLTDGEDVSGWNLIDGSLSTRM